MSITISEYIAALVLIAATFLTLFIAMVVIRREKLHSETLYTGLGVIFGAVLGIPIGDILGLGLTVAMILGAIIGGIVGGINDRRIHKSSEAS
jgi:outer membrane lipoprotein SlyB